MKLFSVGGDLVYSTINIVMAIIILLIIIIKRHHCCSIWPNWVLVGRWVNGDYCMVCGARAAGTPGYTVTTGAATLSSGGTTWWTVTATSGTPGTETSTWPWLSATTGTTEYATGSTTEEWWTTGTATPETATTGYRQRDISMPVVCRGCRLVGNTRTPV